MKKELSINQKNHIFGRIFIGIAILLICAVPVVICLVLKVHPDWKVVVQSFLPLIVFIVSGFVEVITYGPLLGTSGTYLAFITGNLVNLKIPCVVKAREDVNVKHGSNEGEIVSTVSVASSTIVTTLLITVGVLFIVPLRPILESTTLKPGFETACAALFGALAAEYFVKQPKLVPVPLIVTIVLQFSLELGKSVLIPISAILAILFGYFLFKKNKI